MPRYAIVEAPSARGHIPEHRGVERAPRVLLGAGLSDGLAARRARRVAAAGYSAERDPGTKVMNPRAISVYSTLLADAVAAVLDEAEFPVVLGGDCSILLGAMLALKRRGRYGLLYIDGDADFYQPQASPLGGAASDLAFATGRGPGIVADIEGQGPLVRDGDFPKRLLKAATSVDGTAATLAKAALEPNPRTRYRPGLRNRLNTRLLTTLPTRSADRIKTRIAGVTDAAEPARPGAEFVAGLPPAQRAAQSERSSR